MGSLTSYIDRDTEKRFIAIIPLALWLAINAHRKKHKLGTDKLWEEIIRRGWRDLQVDARRHAVIKLVQEP